MIADTTSTYLKLLGIWAVQTAEPTYVYCILYNIVIMGTKYTSYKRKQIPKTKAIFQLKIPLGLKMILQ